MSSFRIVHLATDEKFIDAANYLFEEAFPLQNVFFIIKSPLNPPLKYVTEVKNVTVIKNPKEAVRILLKELRKDDVIVFHGLDEVKVKVFQVAEIRDRVLWILWGAEVYNAEVLDSILLGPKTEKLATELDKGRIINKLKSFYRKIRYGIADNTASRQFKSVLQGLKNAAILHKEEFELFVHQKIISPDCNFFPFTYYPLEFLFKDSSVMSRGSNILLGNSASYTNNHLEAIDLLSQFPLNGSKVYVPLSYGSPVYAEKVISYASSMLGERVVPLLDFLPMPTYNRIISECGVVIMNHYRQQAVGNTLAAIYLGAKVFLNNTTVYQYLRRIGCFVFLIEKDLIKENDDVFNLLSSNEIMHNRRVLEKEISVGTVIANIRNSFHSHFSY